MKWRIKPNGGEKMGGGGRKKYRIEKRRGKKFEGRGGRESWKLSDEFWTRVYDRWEKAKRFPWRQIKLFMEANWNFLRLKILPAYFIQPFRVRRQLVIISEFSVTSNRHFLSVALSFHRRRQNVKNLKCQTVQRSKIRKQLKRENDKK